MVEEKEVMVVAVSDRSFKKAINKKTYWRPSKPKNREIKYIAFYRVSPKSAVTHIAKISSVKQNGGLTVYKLKKATKLRNPIKKGNFPPLQGIMYTTVKKIRSSTYLEDLKFKTDFQKIPKVKRKIFVKNILTWFKTNKRMFSWRKTSNPYKIFVSEVLLQKTVASNVKNVYPVFIKKFPSLEGLSKASLNEIEITIKKLGLSKKKAKFLKESSGFYFKNFGRIPSDELSLMSSKGVGKYTSDAISLFAFGKKKILVDVNVRRVVKRSFGIKKDEEIRSLFNNVLNNSSYKDFNLALIDHAHAICKHKNPLCSNCPVNSVCLYRLA